MEKAEKKLAAIYTAWGSTDADRLLELKDYCYEKCARADAELAAQRAENEFVGCNCGIMDQLISARGEAGHALLIDCRSLLARPVPLPAGLAVMIVHSQVRRGLVDSAYNERRQRDETEDDFFHG